MHRRAGRFFIASVLCPGSFASPALLRNARARPSVPLCVLLAGSGPGRWDVLNTVADYPRRMSERSDYHEPGSVRAPARRNMRARVERSDAGTIPSRVFREVKNGHTRTAILEGAR
jgi:hypothetical protein